MSNQPDNPEDAESPDECHVGCNVLVTCPFCGSDNIDFGGSGDDEPNYMVCRKCKAEGPYAEAGADAARRKWNQRYDGRYGITGKQLDARIVEVLGEWMFHFYGSRPWWLENADERPLEQTITMCLSACLDR